MFPSTWELTYQVALAWLHVGPCATRTPSTAVEDIDGYGTYYLVGDGCAVAAEQHGKPPEVELVTLGFLISRS